MSNVLLVEDSLFAQRLARSQLEQAGHTVTLAPTVRDAIHALEGYDPDDERTQFDLTVLDGNVPLDEGMTVEDNDGTSARRVLYAMRQLEILNKMVIIGLSSKSFTEYNITPETVAPGNFFDLGKENIFMLGKTTLELAEQRQSIVSS